ncbi:MAG: FAD:protein FMN transferase [Gammaproteobacteria bacterium]|nr:FAD:protein FMN transferase [Gammaproteobacteria bacterium]
MRFTSLLITVSLLLPCSVHAEWFKAARGIMGTNIEVDLWDTDPIHAKGCIEEVMGEMKRIDQDMSPYIKTSELYKINQYAAEKPVKISQEMYDLIQRSFYFSDISHGAFDITFASIGYRYDYRKHIKPTDAQIKASLKEINYHHIKLDPEQRTIRFDMQGVRIDLGGIAKGHAVDNSIKLLQRCGIKDAMVTAGGDSRIIGDHDGRPWMTGIKDPRNKKDSIVVIPLVNTAISTSGDYERYFIKNGVRYHHILNPRTGKSVHSTRSVTIIGPDATTTDGLSTTIFVMGPKAGMALVEKLKDVDAVIIDNQGKIHYSSGLMPPSISSQPPQ